MPLELHVPVGVTGYVFSLGEMTRNCTLLSRGMQASSIITAGGMTRCGHSADLLVLFLIPRVRTLAPHVLGLSQAGLS